VDGSRRRLIVAAASPAPARLISSGLSATGRKRPPTCCRDFCRIVPGVNMTPLRSQVTVPTLVLAPATSPVTPLSEQVMITRFRAPACRGRGSQPRDLRRPRGLHQRITQIPRLAKLSGYTN
jgi:hypothetical protein